MPSTINVKVDSGRANSNSWKDWVNQNLSGVYFFYGIVNQRPVYKESFFSRSVPSTMYKSYDIVYIIPLVFQNGQKKPIFPQKFHLLYFRAITQMCNNVPNVQHFLGSLGVAHWVHQVYVNFCHQFGTYFYTKMIFVSHNKVANGTIAMSDTIIYDVPLVGF